LPIFKVCVERLVGLLKKWLYIETYNILSPSALSRASEEGLRLMTYIERFQNAILVILAWTMTLVTLLVTLDVIYTLANYLLLPPTNLQINELLSFFGSILLVLIGVELLETFKNFKQDKTFNVLIALLVALIAISRKVIIMEIEGDPNEMELVGLSALIIALSVGYYLINKSGSIKNK
jgi:uncharacterized membrane protein (DUF373 family)